MQILLRLAYAFPASFNPRSAFSGLGGSLLIRTPTALQIAFTMATIGGTQAISASPFSLSSLQRGDGFDVFGQVFFEL